jgi:simple sugar transport system permease protein
MRIPLAFMKAMVMSGAIAGLAGAIEVLGVNHAYASGFQRELGMQGIIASLLVRNHPIGVVASGLFFGALQTGAMNMQRLTDVPRAMVDLVRGLIVLAVSAQAGLEFLQRRRRHIDDCPKEV